MGSRSEGPARVEPTPAPTVLGPAALGRRPQEPFPAGVWVEIAPEVQRLTPTALFGGTPPRIVRLGRRGAVLVSAFAHEPVRAGASAQLARRLTDAGLATPRPGPVTEPVDVTVVVPVRDRLVELSACLDALGDRHRVVVVDDGSTDPQAVAAACAAHGADLVRRDASGGPAAARNAGLRTVTTDLVAFVDSDCLAGPDWIEALAGHFVDPLVVGVAPRIVAAPPMRGPSLVDLGTRPASVHPRSHVSHVPAAAVVFRRGALGGGFDEALRYGEDVDLVWRLAEAGWRVRYAPEVEVGHRDPVRPVPRWRRRYHYGTSVGPLERRHPGAIVHLRLGVGTACTVGSLLLGLPVPATVAWGVTAMHLHRRLRPLGVGGRAAIRFSVGQTLNGWVGLSRWCTMFGAPLLVASLLGVRFRAARRLLRLLFVLVGSALVTARLGPRGEDRRLLTDACLGELAYGLGVCVGCLRAGVIAPVVPRVGLPER